jgi:hypothetical protein
VKGTRGSGGIESQPAEYSGGSHLLIDSIEVGRLIEGVHEGGMLSTEGFPTLWPAQCDWPLVWVKIAIFVFFSFF